MRASKGEILQQISGFKRGLGFYHPSSKLSVVYEFVFFATLNDLFHTQFFQTELKKVRKVSADANLKRFQHKWVFKISVKCKIGF